jgi:UDP-4-amino-4,6-dideoxy-N-acetyl-beta-L-altrosamine transaminase
MISYGKQSVDQADIDAVIEALRGDWLTQGPCVSTFEDDLSKYFGSENCTVVSNGTAALHLAGLAFGWGEGDVVLTSPITFLASANCAIYSGAVPDFVDIDPDSYNVDPEKLETKIQSLLREGKKVKALVGVDYAGNPCDWEAFRAIADEYNLQLINDNCHAMGADLFGDRHYAIKYADMVIQSYHPVKHITCGEGGAVFTHDTGIDAKVKLLRSHGMTKAIDQLEKNDGPWYYEMHEFGFNYRLTDIQAALGSSQLKKLTSFVEKRKKIANVYNESFAEIEVFSIPKVKDGFGHAYHLYPLLIDFDRIALSKVDLFNELKNAGIQLQVHYQPVHLQPFYRKRYGFAMGDFPVAEDFYSREVSLPIYPDLSESDQKHVIDSIFGILDVDG